jgi:DNA polymerase I-like protein with 3'-5' exonuclease and polymerase domains
VLTRRYGWVPEEFTDDGNPKLDEEVLDSLENPLGKELSKYFMLDKRCGSLAEGDEAYLKVVDSKGYLHCETIGSGTVTLRASHRHPNLSQTTSAGKPYGKEFRECFRVPEGRKFVGVDQSGLELRCLAHDLARYDGGKFAQEVVEGDVHTYLAGIYWPGQEITKQGLRRAGKTVTYALLYGCGDAKLAKVLNKRRGQGKRERARISQVFPAYAKLVEDCKHRHATWGRVPVLDGRRVQTRGAHSSVNTRLQANGAVICKWWVVLMKEKVEREFLDAKLILWSHDEVGYDCSEDCAERVVQIGQQAARETGELLGFRVRLDTEGHVGSTWADVH